MQGDYVLLGKIAGPFGIKGWLRIISFTEPQAKIFDYRPWHLKQNAGFVETELAACTKENLTAALPSVSNRDQAQFWAGAEIWVTRTQLPKLHANQHYWADLEGLEVVDLSGNRLGTVSHLFSTGANDVMVVRGEKEQLIPFIAHVIKKVDQSSRVITVDWDPAF